MNIDLQCYKCQVKSTKLYYCCHLERNQPVCYDCSQGMVGRACNKKYNNPIGKSESRIGNKKGNQCNNCKKYIADKDSSIYLECEHYLCVECIPKRIQKKIRFKEWQKDYYQDKDNAYISCICASMKNRINITRYLKQRCFCCGNNFGNNKKTQLKYGLVIRQQCRINNSIKFSHDQFNSDNFIRLLYVGRPCRVCSKQIDGMDVQIGQQQQSYYQCKGCYDDKLKRISSSRARKQQVSSNLKDKQHQNVSVGYPHLSKVNWKKQLYQCINCNRQFEQHELVNVDSFAKICNNCLRQSRQREDQHHRKRPFQNIDNYADVLKKKTLPELSSEKKSERNHFREQQVSSEKVVHCLICNLPLFSKEEDVVFCSKCSKKPQYFDFIQQMRKQKQQQRSNKSYVNRKQSNKQREGDADRNKERMQSLSNIKQKESHSQSKICVACNRDYRYQNSIIQQQFEQQLSSLMCNICIKANKSHSLQRKQHQDRHVMQQQSMIDYNFKDIDTLDYRRYLQSCQDLSFNPRRYKKQANHKYSNSVSKPPLKPNLIYTVIQQIPDKDVLDIEISHNVVNCNNCGYGMQKRDAMKLNQVYRCLPCHFTTLAKSKI